MSRIIVVCCMLAIFSLGCGDNIQYASRSGTAEDTNSDEGPCDIEPLPFLPELTSNQSAEPVFLSESSARDDSVFGQRPAWKAFDRKNETEADAWVSDERVFNNESSPEYIQLNLGPSAPKLVTRLELTAMNKDSDRRAPRTFQLLGSNDEENWTVLLDVEDDAQLTAAGATATYEIAPSAAYRIFQISVEVVHMDDATSDDNYVAIGEAQLYGCAAR